MGKTYSCERCDHKFTSQWKLNRHLKVHEKKIVNSHIFTILKRLLSIRKKIDTMEKIEKNILNIRVLNDLKKENEDYTKIWNEKKMLFT